MMMTETDGEAVVVPSDQPCPDVDNRWACQNCMMNLIIDKDETAAADLNGNTSRDGKVEGPPTLPPNARPSSPPGTPRTINTY